MRQQRHETLQQPRKQRLGACTMRCVPKGAMGTWRVLPCSWKLGGLVVPSHGAKVSTAAVGG
eukprot:11104940-Alexandrium_andersonii.AAC.1